MKRGALPTPLPLFLSHPLPYHSHTPPRRVPDGFSFVGAQTKSNLLVRLLRSPPPLVSSPSSVSTESRKRSTYLKIRTGTGINVTQLPTPEVERWRDESNQGEFRRTTDRCRLLLLHGALLLRNVISSQTMVVYYEKISEISNS